MASQTFVLPKHSNWKWPLRAVALAIFLWSMERWGAMIMSTVRALLAWAATWPWADILIIFFGVAGIIITSTGLASARCRPIWLPIGAAFLLAAFAVKG